MIDRNIHIPFLAPVCHLDCPTHRQVWSFLAMSVHCHKNMMDGAGCRVRGALKGSLASAGGWGSATTRGHFKTATKIKHDGPFSKMYGDKTFSCSALWDRKTKSWVVWSIWNVLQWVSRWLTCILLVLMLESCLPWATVWSKMARISLEYWFGY